MFFDSLVALYILEMRFAELYPPELSWFIMSSMDGYAGGALGAALGAGGPLAAAVGAGFTWAARGARGPLGGGGCLGAADALGPPGGAGGALAGALPPDVYYGDGPVAGALAYG